MWLNSCCGPPGNRTQTFSVQTKRPAFGMAPINYAESIGFEPMDPFQDHSLANCCITTLPTLHLKRKVWDSNSQINFRRLTCFQDKLLIQPDTFHNNWRCSIIKLPPTLWAGGTRTHISSLARLVGIEPTKLDLESNILPTKLKTYIQRTKNPNFLVRVEFIRFNLILKLYHLIHLTHI